MVHCRFTPNLIDDSFAIAKYDFDNPIYQAKDEGEEDCEVLGELSRLLQQEEKCYTAARRTDRGCESRYQ